MKLADRNQIQVPKQYQIALEVMGVLDVAKLLYQIPNFSDHPKGNGEPIIVLPGFATNDHVTYPMRKYLEFLGYRAEGWDLGYNHGIVPKLLEEFQIRLERTYQKYGRKVNLIGWSLGGYIARESARDNQDKISKVISIGSPLIGGPKYTSIANYYAKKQNMNLDDVEKEVDERYNRPLEMPLLSIYSKNDNIVSWESSIDHFSPNIKHVEVNATHLGLILNPDVYLQIAQFLQNVNTG
ncbi:hypothetical protein P3G55_16960 [Leptospira sp. 96542]|nr:hypothetical protein [Leptospira sp. 96542]